MSPGSGRRDGRRERVKDGGERERERGGGVIVMESEREENIEIKKEKG